MEDVDLRYAKEHLDELIARAARGEDVRIFAQPGVGDRAVDAWFQRPRSQNADLVVGKTNCPIPPLTSSNRCRTKNSRTGTATSHEIAARHAHSRMVDQSEPVSHRGGSQCHFVRWS